MVEWLGRRTWNPEVAGSSPAHTTKLESFLGGPKFKSSVMLVNSHWQLVCFPPVGIFKPMFSWYSCLFQFEVACAFFTITSNIFEHFLNTFTGRKRVKTKVKVSVQEFYRQSRGNNTRTSGVWCSFQRSWVSQWKRFELFKILKYQGELSFTYSPTQRCGIFSLWDAFVRRTRSWKAFVMVTLQTVIFDYCVWVT